MSRCGGHKRRSTRDRCGRRPSARDINCCRLQRAQLKDYPGLEPPPPGREPRRRARRTTGETVPADLILPRAFRIGLRAGKAWLPIRGAGEHRVVRGGYSRCVGRVSSERNPAARRSPSASTASRSCSLRTFSALRINTACSDEQGGQILG